jgi:hypothetical protein
MINRSTLALCIAVAALCPTSIVFGQSRDAFGPVLPMVFDGQGGRHYCLYGYYGPLDPSIAPAKDYTTVVCPRDPPLTQWLRGAQKSHSAPGKARAQAKTAN